MTLEVIGAGFGRTGTLSMKAALERLGFGPCYHMLEVWLHPEHADAWATAISGGPFDVEAELGGYRSTVDFPGCMVWRELAEMNPDAKVLLTVRPAEDWWRSFASTIGPNSRDFVPADESQQGIRRLFDTIGFSLFADAEGMREVLVNGGEPDIELGREAAITAFERHNAAVIAEVDPERLLVYEVGSGWEPLCEFLGVDVPDEPYPHTNTTEQFKGLQ